MQAVVLLLGAVTVVVLVAPPPPRPPDREPGAALGAALRTRGVAGPLVLLLLNLTSFQILLFTLPLYCAMLGMAATVVGVLFTVQSLAYTLPQRRFGALLDRSNPFRVLAFSTIATGPVATSLALTDNAWLLGLLMVGYGLVSAPVFVAVTLMISRVAGDRTGLVMGSVNAISYLSTGIAPVLAGLVAQWAITVGLVLPTVLSALAVPLLVMLRPVGTRGQSAGALT